MDGTTIGLIAVVAVFGINIVLLLGLVVLKTVHRRQMRGRVTRRAGYIALLSRHLSIPNHTDPIPASVVRDSAFIDAVIDMRHTLSGPEIDTLAGVVDRLGLADRQVRSLNAKHPLGRRLRAAVSLAEMGDESTARVLIAHLSDTEPEIRIQAARGLGRMRYTAAIDPILDRLAIEEPWVRTRFADTLVGFGTRASWPLAAYIRVNLGHDENIGVIEAIRVLAAIGDRELGPTIAGVLGMARDPEVKIAAIDALGKLGGPMALGKLEDEFHSDDWRLRAKAATAFGEIGDPSMNVLLAGSLGDENWWVRRNSAAALTILPEGVGHLIAVLGSDDDFARDAAAEALADAGELSAARERVAAGTGTNADAALLEYITAQPVEP
jgi:HEAT repeat protein